MAIEASARPRVTANASTVVLFALMSCSFL
jgi:hypothetical protein